MHCGSAKRLNGLTALSKRHTHNSPGKPRPLNVGDVVIICSEDKNRGNWSLGVV